MYGLLLSAASFAGGTAEKSGFTSRCAKPQKISALKRTSNLCCLCHINRGGFLEEDILPSRPKRWEMHHRIKDLQTLRCHKLRHCRLPDPLLRRALQQVPPLRQKVGWSSIRFWGAHLGSEPIQTFQEKRFYDFKCSYGISLKN